MSNLITFPSGLMYNPDGNIYSEFVNPLLKRHDQSSYIGTNTDLYTVFSNGFPKYQPPPALPEWDCSRPTCPPPDDESVSKYDPDPKNNWGNLEVSLTNQGKWFSEVIQFVKDTPGVIIAGGFITRTFLSIFKENSSTRSEEYRDLDLFLTGPAASSKTVAIKTIKKLEKVFLRVYQSSISRYRWRTVHASRGRTTNCINFIIGKSVVQVILRSYSHPSEVLHSFDLGSCQLGYDGDELFTTSAGLLAFQMGINVIDLKRRRRTYEYRLNKYWNRGFGVVFPGLSPAALEKEEEIKTEYLKLCQWNIKTQISGFNVLVKGKELNTEEYSGMLESYKIQNDPYETGWHNIRHYIREKIAGIPPYYLIAIVDRVWNYQNGINNYDRSKKLSICNDLTTVNLDMRNLSFYRFLEKSIRESNLKTMTPSRLISRIPRSLKDKCFTFMYYYYVNDPEGKVESFKKDLLKEIAEFEIGLKTNLTKKTVPLTLRGPGEGNDLNASFGMARVPPAEWYGKYYLPDYWEPKLTKNYLESDRTAIFTIALLHRFRPQSGLGILPIEILFHIFDYLVISN